MDINETTEDHADRAGSNAKEGVGCVSSIGLVAALP